MDGSGALGGVVAVHGQPPQERAVPIGSLEVAPPGPLLPY